MKEILAFALVEMVKQGMPLAIDLFEVMSKPVATDADWDALRAKWRKDFNQRIEDAKQRALPLS